MEPLVSEVFSYHCKDCGSGFLDQHKLQRHVRAEHETQDTVVEYRCIPAEVSIGDERRDEQSGTAHEPPVRLHIRLNHVSRDRPSKKADGDKRDCGVPVHKEHKKRGRSFCRRCNVFFFSKILFEQHLKTHVRKTDAVVRLMRLPISVEVLRNANKNYPASPEESQTASDSTFHKQPPELSASNGADLGSMLVNERECERRVTVAERSVSRDAPLSAAIQPNRVGGQEPPPLRCSNATNQAASEAAAESFDRNLMAELNSHIKSLAESIMRGPKESSDVEPTISVDFRSTNISLDALPPTRTPNETHREGCTLSTIPMLPLPKSSVTASDSLAAAPPKLISLPFFSPIAKLANCPHPNSTATRSLMVSSSVHSGSPSVSFTAVPTSSSSLSSAAPNTLAAPSLNRAVVGGAASCVTSEMLPSGQSYESGSRLCAILKSALVAPTLKSVPCPFSRPVQPLSTVAVNAAASTAERRNSVAFIEKDSSPGQTMTPPGNVSARRSAGPCGVGPNPSPLAMLSQLNPPTTTVARGMGQETTDAMLARPASVIVLDSPSANEEEHPRLSIQSVVSLAPDHAQELWGEAAGPHVLDDRRSQCRCGVCRNVRDGNLLPKSEMKLSNGRVEYYCPVCRRRFTHKISLFRHCRSFEHAFVCDMCSCGFLDQATFEAHKKSIHLVNMYSPLNAPPPNGTALSGATPSLPKHYGQRYPPNPMRPPPLVSAPVSRANRLAASSRARAGSAVVSNSELAASRRRKQTLQPRVNPNPSPTEFHDRFAARANAEDDDDDVVVVGVERGRSNSSGTLPRPPPLKRRPLPNAIGPPNKRFPGQPVPGAGLTRHAPVAANRMLETSSPSSTLVMQRLPDCDSRGDIAGQPSQLARILRNSEITLTPIGGRSPEATPAQGKRPQQETRASPTSASNRLVQPPPTGPRASPSACPTSAGPGRNAVVPFRTCPSTNLRAALAARQRMALEVARTSRPPQGTGSTTYRVHPVTSQMAKRPETTPSAQFQSPKDSNRCMPVWHHPVADEADGTVVVYAATRSVLASDPGGGQKLGPRTPTTTTVRPPPLVTTLPSCHQSHGPNKFPSSIGNLQTNSNDSVFMPPPPPYPRPSGHQLPPPYRPPNQVSRVTWANPQQTNPLRQSAVAPPPPLTSRTESSRAAATVRCNLCEMTFLTQFAFQAHFNLMHGNPQRQVYQCGRCQRIYNKPAHLKRHEMNCTEKVLCVKCNRLYYRNELLAHYSIDHFPGARSSPSSLQGPVGLATDPRISRVSVDDGSLVTAANQTLVAEDVAPVINAAATVAGDLVASPDCTPVDGASHCLCTEAPADGELRQSDESLAAAFVVDSPDAPYPQTPENCTAWDENEVTDTLSVVSEVVKQLVERVVRETPEGVVTDESEEMVVRCIRKEIDGETFHATRRDSQSDCRELEPVLEDEVVSDDDAAAGREPPPFDEGVVATPVQGRRTSDTDTQSDDTLSIDCAESLELHLSNILEEDKMNDGSWGHDDQLLSNDPESPKDEECVAAHEDGEEPVKCRADADACVRVEREEREVQDSPESPDDTQIHSEAEEGSSSETFDKIREDPEIVETGSPTEGIKESSVVVLEDGSTPLEMHGEDVRKGRVCPICDQEFFSDRKFFRHIELHQGVPVHRCHNCQARFHSRKLLMNHFRTHLRSCANLPRNSHKAKRQRLNDDPSGGRRDFDQSRLVVALLDLKQVEANKEFLRRMGVVGLMTLEDLRAFFEQKSPSSSSAASDGEGPRNVPMINLEDE